MCVIAKSNRLQQVKKCSILTSDIRNNLRPPYNKFQRQIKVHQWMTTIGSYLHKPMVIFFWYPKNISVLQYFQNIDGFKQYRSRSLFNMQAKRMMMACGWCSESGLPRFDEGKRCALTTGMSIASFLRMLRKWQKMSWTVPWMFSSVLDGIP